MKLPQFSKKEPKPYWYVDAKWIFGLLLIVSLSILSFIYGLYKLTEENPAVELSTILMASAFSPNGLDDTGDLKEFKSKIATQAGEVIYPLANIKNVSINKSDLEKYPPQELRLKLFRQISEPLYFEGAEGFAKKLTDDPNQQKKFANDAFLVSIFSRTFHQNLQNILFISAIINLFFVIAFVFFSFGFGKIGNLGWVMLIVGLPGTFLSSILNTPTLQVNTSEGALGGSQLKMIAPFISNIPTSAIKILLSGYQIAATGGALLIIFAIIGKSAWKIKVRRQKLSQ
ncbi:MAG: hypothetical protein M1150_03155 [Patescibacteria group bacterium]|nr:hypothetical protein [Patescibacteria group bacterium]